jgi:hypothetical protein
MGRKSDREFVRRRLRENVARFECLTEDQLVDFVLRVVNEHWPSDDWFEITPEMFD